MLFISRIKLVNIIGKALLQKIYYFCKYLHPLEKHIFLIKCLSCYTNKKISI